jgi:hypothetical protein
MESLHFVPIFEWTMLSNENEKSDLRKSYQISDFYSIVGKDNNGNILVEYENKLFKNIW